MGFRINNVFLSHSKHDMNKGLMNGRTTMKLFGLFGLLILLYCGCADRHRHKPFCEQELVDSLEVRVQDSLFSNVLYSRSQVRDALVQVQDSQVYYRLLALYGKTFFVWLSCNSWGITLCNFPFMHTPLLIYTGRTSYLPLHEMKP